MPVFYDCKRCTACCRWPGQVKVTDAEIRAIAAHLGLSEDAFIQNHTRLNFDRSGLSLLDQENGWCAYFDGAGCRIQPVKPQQCRDFPNVWNFPGFQKQCQAVALELGEDDYRRRMFAATGRPEFAPAKPT